MKKKLRSRCGETLVEALCSILIAALAAALLAGMTTSASRMNAAALENDSALYSAISRAETFTGKLESGKLNVTIGEKTTEINVDVYGDIVHSYAESAGE